MTWVAQHLSLVEMMTVVAVVTADRGDVLFLGWFLLNLPAHDVVLTKRRKQHVNQMMISLKGAFTEVESLTNFNNHA